MEGLKECARCRAQGGYKEGRFEGVPAVLLDVVDRGYEGGCAVPGAMRHARMARKEV